MGLEKQTHSGKFKNIESHDFTKQWSPDQLLNLIMDEPFYFSPGHGFHYSNTHYVLAGMVFKAASGQSLDESIKIDY